MPFITLRCAIVGEGTLPQQCAEILLARGHTIAAIISPDPRFIRWAEEHSLPSACDPAALPALLAGAGLDYLFSIVNYQMLPLAALTLPQRGAINYHDAPLPRYAGTYATSWALMNRERNYAISWHMMVEQVDAGAIVRQAPVEIAPDDSALTLNARCYEVAIAAFGQLIADLETGRLPLMTQDLSQRTYFARDRRPPAAALLRWDEPAITLDALIRALSFGPYRNPLTLPKLWLGDRCLAITAHDLLLNERSAPPGTILACDAHGLTVAATVGALRLRGLATLEGQALPLDTLASRPTMRPGARLPVLDPVTVERIDQLVKRLARHERFWLRTLADLQPVSLPFIRPTTHTGGPVERRTVTTILPSARLLQLQIQLQPNTTAQEVALIACAAYVARLVGLPGSDIGFAPASLRDFANDLPPLVTTTLPLRLAWNADDTFAQFAQSFQAQCSRVQAHHTFMRDLPARYPETRAIGELQQAAGWPVVIELLATAPTESTNAVPSRELTIQLAPDGSTVRWCYDPNNLSRAQIERMGQQLLTLLDAIATHPDQPLRQLELLPAKERHTLLVERNATAQPFDQAVCVQQLFDRQVDRTPTATALVAGTTRLTYQALQQRTNRLAQRLRHLGVTTETRVGVCLERSADLVVALLAVWKAGGAYVPIDPAYPTERVAMMIEDGNATLLITQRSLVPRLPTKQTQIICLDELPALAEEPAHSPAQLTTSRNLAYVLFTSGSTGRPKGVAIEHRSVVALLAWAHRLYTPEELAGVLAATSVCFDLSIFELFVPLTGGGCVVLVENALALLNLPAEPPITLVNTVPSVMAEVVRTGTLPASVCTVNLAGEPLAAALVQRVYTQPGVKRVYDLYGPSEDTTYSTCALRRSDGPTTIGRPLPNTRIYLLGPNQQLVPEGAPGELTISGAGLARGYLNRPELTEAAFRPNPFADPHTDDDLYTRMYKTGDLARYLPDGQLEYLGRIDHQVKVRGFRIELGEIEAVLLRHPQVRAAVAVARAEPGQPRRLIAYLAPRDQHIAHDATRCALLASELRMRIAAKLPDYMMPAAFVVLEALPLTPNGKVDRRALPAPQRSAGVGETTYEEPQNATEALLAGIWARVLGMPRVGIHDNFFALGGDSILTIQIVSQAQQAGLRITPRQIFQHQTVAGLAGVAQPVVPTVQDQAPVSGSAPLTPIQHWFFNADLPNPSHWNQAQLLETSSGLNVDVLTRSLRLLSDHHDALRLRFTHTERGWTQVHAAPGAPVPLIRIDASNLDGVATNRALQQVAEDLQATLNIEYGPVIRAAYLDAGSRRPGQLLIVAHHLVIDGVSWRILLEDLQALYQQLATDPTATPQLTAKSTAFKAWAEALPTIARNGTFTDDLAYWLAPERLHVRSLPTDMLRRPGSLRESGARMVSLTLDAAETRALLQAVPAAYHSQINDVLLTALVCSFTDWTKQASLLIDLEGHGREEVVADADLSRTIGWFTAIFPVLLNIVPTETPLEALKRVKQQLRAIPHRGVSYGLLRYLGEPALAQQLAQQPRAEISFNYLGQFDHSLGAGSPFQLVDGAPGPLHDPQGNRPHLIEVSGSVVGGQLRMHWAYSPALHHTETIERLAANFMGVLRTLVAGVAAPQTAMLTPTDVPLAQINQATLDHLSTAIPNLVDLYPLAPGQAEMFAHTLAEPNSGAYNLLWRCELRGTLDSSLFARAWQQLALRHPIFRTSFAWQDLPQPLQMVRNHVELPLPIHDLRSLAAPGRQARMTALLNEELNRGFDLTRAPLIRPFLFRISDDRTVFALNYHHLLLDGWSIGPLLGDLLAIYGAQRPDHHELPPEPGQQSTRAYPGVERRRRNQPQRDGDLLAAAPPFRSYLTWLAAQDHAAARRFWHHELQGLRLVPFAYGPPPRPGVHGYSEVRTHLDATATAQLRSLASELHITLNTLIQGTVARLLTTLTRQSEVVLGITVATRPPQITHIERIVGPCINTLPLRLAIPPHAPLETMLQAIQQRQAEVRQYDYLAAAEIRRAADLPADAPLFEVVLRFQNYPLDRTRWQHESGLLVGSMHWIDRWHYPLCIVVEPGDELGLELTYDRRRLSDIGAESLIAELVAALREIHVESILG